MKTASGDAASTAAAACWAWLEWGAHALSWTSLVLFVLVGAALLRQLQKQYDRLADEFNLCSGIIGEGVDCYNNRNTKAECVFNVSFHIAKPRFQQFQIFFCVFGG